MHILKPLYGIAKAGTHWYATYFKHHEQKLNMEMSSYDPCLLISRSRSKNEPFEIVAMQTDDTLILGYYESSKLEEEKLIKASLKAKPKEKLSDKNPLIFNGCIVSMKNPNILIQKKEQGKGFN